MKLKLCEIVQQMEYVDLELIKSVLEEKKCIRDYAYIIHNKDKDTKKHIHIAIRFTNSYDTKYISNWFNIPEQYIGKVKGKWSDMLNYLTHRNAPDKFQYDDIEVVSNFDWTVERDGKGSDSRKNEIMNRIVSGDIREYNIHKEIDIIEYDKYKRSIENAFVYRQKILSEKSDREMEVIFITGKSGSGKTTYAKMLCDNKDYSYFVSSSSNDPFDGYLGQDAIILDDLRGSSFTFADLLKITDNHTSSAVKSRYKNKVLECKLLIITSIMPIDEFYKNIFESAEEPLEQFKRRCQTYIKMEKERMTVYGFDNNTMDYHRFGVSKNPVVQKFAFENANSLNKRLEIIKDTLCGIEFDDSFEFEEVAPEEQIEW